MKSNTQVFDKRLAKHQPSTEFDPTSKIVSYTQYSMYEKCPRQWELSYIHKLAPKSQSIHLVYGNALHSVIQEWLSLVFTVSVKKSEEYDFAVNLKKHLSEEYKKAVQQVGDHFSTPQQLAEFYQDGLDTLNWLRKKRTAYFSTKCTELAAIELPISLPPLSSFPKVKLTAFVDLVFYDTRTKVYTIIDLKTSTRGWSEDDKRDYKKTDQVLMYKKYFCEQYKVDPEKVRVEFMILRRKIQEDTMYPPKRVQSVQPAQKGVSINKFDSRFSQWIQKAFLVEGKYKPEVSYPAVSGPGHTNCRFCPFSTRYDLCPTQSRVSVKP